MVQLREGGAWHVGVGLPLGVVDCSEGGVTLATTPPLISISHRTRQSHPWTIDRGEGEGDQREGTGVEFEDETMQLSVPLPHPG